MSLNQKHLHLVAYDISDPKRLLDVRRYLKKLGLPLQYSVFLLYITPEQKRQVVWHLNRLINPRYDDVRIYPLPQNPEWQWWGKPVLMDGVKLPGIPLPEGIESVKLKSAAESENRRERQLSGVKKFPQRSL